jgi:hypothetical protein
MDLLASQAELLVPESHFPLHKIKGFQIFCKPFFLSGSFVLAPDTDSKSLSNIIKKTCFHQSFSFLFWRLVWQILDFRVFSGLHGTAGHF